MQHGSSDPQPQLAVLPHLRRFETPDMAQFGGCPQQAVGTGWDTAADCGLYLTHQTEDLAWLGTQKKKNPVRRMKSAICCSVPVWPHSCLSVSTWLGRVWQSIKGGSVTRDRSGWGFTVKQDGRTVHEDSGAHRVTTSSLTMEVEAVTHAIQWLASQRDARITHAIILTDSMNLLQKVESGMGCPDWHTAMHSLRLQRLLWIYCPGHARVSGNEWADRLASTADITSGLQLGRAEVLRGLRNFLSTDKPEHHSIDRLKERGVEKGSGQHSTLQGRERSVFNQTNIGTVSRATLGRLLRDGAERVWAFPSATMPSWAETELKLKLKVGHNCMQWLEVCGPWASVWQNYCPWRW